MTINAWLDDTGLVTLPSGPRVRGRRQSDTVSPADFTLLLGDGPVPAWPHRHIRWPDFWIPINRADALDALREAHRRARAGERVEVTCRGGIGRTGTALAALAILDGLPSSRQLDPGQLQPPRRGKPVATTMASQCPVTNTSRLKHFRAVTQRCSRGKWPRTR